MRGKDGDAHLVVAVCSFTQKSLLNMTALLWLKLSMSAGR